MAWFIPALLAAFFYALLWVLGRASRGMPSGVVTTLQFAFGPMLLFFAARTIDFPWGEWWWWLYLLLPLCVCPLVSRALTYAVHTTEVTLVKPLFGLSSIATLLVSSLAFGERIESWGVLGILLVTIGLILLYRERWGVWRRPGPWMVLAGALIFGMNAAVVADVLRRFPHIIAITGFTMTGSLLLNGTLSLRQWRGNPWTLQNGVIVLGMAIVLPLQDYLTGLALSLGPSAYVMAVKRTSVLITAVLGYIVLRERDQSLPRLLSSAALVVAGVAALVLT